MCQLLQALAPRSRYVLVGDVRCVGRAGRLPSAALGITFVLVSSQVVSSKLGSWRAVAGQNQCVGLDFGEPSIVKCCLWSSFPNTPLMPQAPPPTRVLDQSFLPNCTVSPQVGFL